MAGQKKRIHADRGNYLWAVEGQKGIVSYSTHIGFDLVRCKVNVESINWSILNAVLDNSKGIINIKSPLPENHNKRQYQHWQTASFNAAGQ